ncbi:MAG: hypothetical protein ACYCW6_25400 [Candidatus Xenobia bacterium]
MDIEERLKRIEVRLDRDYQHLETVVATQREIVQKAFDQVNLALLEQQMAFRTYAESTRENLQDLRELVLIAHTEISEIKKRLDKLEHPPTTA